MSREKLTKLARSSLKALFLQMHGPLKSYAARGVRVKLARVIAVPAPVGYSLRLIQHLEAPPDPEARPLVLDLTMCPLRPSDLRCNAARSHCDGTARIGPGIEVLELRSGETWDGAELEFTFDWPVLDTRGGLVPRCLVFPDFAPRLLSTPLPSSGTRREQTRIQVQPPSDGRIQLGGIPFSVGGSVPQDSNDLLQAVVLFTQPPDTAGEIDSSKVLLSSEFASGLSVGECLRATNTTTNILKFISKCLGPIPGTRVVVANHASFQGAELEPLGASLCVSPGFFGIGQLNSTPARPVDFSLAGRLATIWWGHGCGISGTHGREMGHGICVAIGLAWTRRAGRMDLLQQTLQRLRSEATAPRRGDQLLAAQGLSKERLIASLALALDEAICRNKSMVLAELRNMVQENWGYALNEETVATSLAKVGVTMPAVFSE